MERLQARSDKLRLQFLRAELELCMTFAKIAADEHKRGRPEDASRNLGHAEMGYSTLLQYMSDPKHSKHFSSSELGELSEGVARLRRALDDVKQS